MLIKHACLLLLIGLLGACSAQQPTPSPVALLPTATLEPPTATLEPPTVTPEPPTATLEPPTATAEPPTATPEPVATYKGAVQGTDEVGAPTLGAADAPLVLTDYSDFL